LIEKFEPGNMKSVSFISQPLPQPISMNKGRNVVRKDFDFRSMQYHLEDDELASSNNVQVNIPQVGTSYSFEKLLVLEQAQKIGIQYRLRNMPDPGFFQKIVNWMNVK